MTGITTKKGDQGRTELLFGVFVEKGHPQVEALGEVDELNAALGMVRILTGEGLRERIDRIQGWLVILMGELAMPEGKEEQYERVGFKRVGGEEIRFLEEWSQELEKGREVRGWLRPGLRGDELTARLHVARTVARRAERRVWAVSDQVASADLRVFLNRLSDFLWLVTSEGVRE